jgi:hypothetical protein
MPDRFFIKKPIIDLTVRNGDVSAMPKLAE